jgi:long-chain fatty acid transport protein
MIGLGAESRSMGGTGIAHFIGAQNALINPAMLAKSTSKKEFSFGGTIFNANVKSSTTAGNGSNGSNIPGKGLSRSSDQGKSMIPAVAISHRLSDTLVFGLGMYGTAGMGTDWRAEDTPYQADIHNNALMNIGLYNMRSSLMLMQFAPSLAYGNKTYGIGLTTIMQYGQLSIDYDTYDMNNENVKKHVGDGMSDDYGYGYQLGAYFNPISSLTLGAVYKSAISMTYKNQISKASLAFGYGAHPAALAKKEDTLEQPAEFGFGVAYSVNNILSYTLDIKKIKWGSAKGYKDFGWVDQTVYALGVNYKKPDYWVGLGYNYGKSPLVDNKSTKSVAGGQNTDGDTMNLFNYAMFPATVETAYTFGGGYKLDKNTMMEMAFTYSPEISKTVSARTVGVGDITSTHSQNATTIAVKYTF